MIFLNNVDFDKNQIINVALQNSATAPSAPVLGQIYYNTSGVVYYWNGTAWVGLNQGFVSSITGGNGLTATGTGAVTLDVNVDNSTIEIVGDIVRIKDLGVVTGKIADAAVTAVKLASDSVTTIKVIDKAITFAKIADIPTMSVIGRVSGGSGSASAISILNENDLVSNSATGIPTQASVKAYVDAAVAGIGVLQGSFNATTSTLFPGTAATKAGDYWYVTVAGTVQSVVLNIGDMLIANVDNPSTTDFTKWIFVESNRDQASTTVLGLVYLATAAEVNTGTDTVKAVTPATLAQRTATETRTGIAEIATTSETTAGSDDSRIITPLKLAQFMTQYVSGNASNIGNGTLLTYTVTHNLNTLDLAANLVRVVDGVNVMTDITFPTVNTAVVTFSKAPTTNQYRLVLKK